MNKKILCALLAVVMAAFSLSACAKNEMPGAITNNEPSAAPVVVSAETPAPTEAPTPTPTPEPTPTPTPEPRSSTSGRKVSEGTPLRPVIVSIENSNGAKPQTALMYADIVYEFLVEGTITRFQALFNDTYAPYAGPLRSARYYFIDLAQEWGCMYLHEGYGPWEGPYYRSPSAIAKRVGVYPRSGEDVFNGFSAPYSHSSGGYLDYDDGNGYRFRSKDRKSPHNLFVLVDKTAHDYFGDYTAEAHERFGFGEGVKYDGAQSFTSVALSYGNTKDDNWIEFDYDAATNRLLRKESGKKFMTLTPSADGETLTKEQMNVQNLIVQYCDYGKMKDDPKNRRTVELTGEGKCEYFINGQHVTGTWSRPALEDFTTYRLDDGSTVVLEPGNTWIAIHPMDAPVTVE